MKLVLSAAMALAIAAPAFAQPTGAMNGGRGMSGAHGADHSSMTMANGVGAVTAVDVKAGTVTIHHGPISALNWPAMTMAFKASAPSVLQGVKAGQSVKFQLMKMGGSVQLTAIQPN
jgi:Cu(I)/Ag(I) efflux system protein CusF